MSWSAAILAGGHARRLGGQDKRALSIDGARILERQLAALTPLTSKVVCIGGGAVPQARDVAPVACVDDLMPGYGALGGLYTALATAATDRILVLACDLPFVTTPFLEFLLRVDPHAMAVIPAPGAADLKFGPACSQPLCAVYHRTAAAIVRDALESGQRRVRQAVHRLGPHYVLDADLRPYDTDGRLLWNVNTPDDLAQAKAHQTDGRHRTAAFRTSQTATR
jgi:molybdenum cofactor guanylyltransferase